MGHYRDLRCSQTGLPAKICLGVKSPGELNGSQDVALRAWMVRGQSPSVAAVMQRHSLSPISHVKPIPRPGVCCWPVPL